MLLHETEIFVETQWLADHLDNQEMRIVDLRFNRCFSNHHKMTLECWEDYREAHIPRAVYIDCIEDLTEPSYKDIFYVPSPNYFAEVMGRAGINNQTLIICYDDAPYPLASARFWWTALYFNHKNVRILKGGIRKWMMEGRPLSSVVNELESKSFIPSTCKTIRVAKRDIQRSLNDSRTIIIDCLPFRQYHGNVLNPWSIRKGHIPGAVWLPPAELVKGLDRASPERKNDDPLNNERSYFFFPEKELHKIFRKAGVEEGKRIITYCGKGDAACSVFLALKMIGTRDVAVYDGSLAEWSRDPDLAMEIT